MTNELNAHQASQYYDGEIPDSLRRMFLHGDHGAYCIAFLRTAERNFYQRCQDVVQSLIVWRRHAGYPPAITCQMLQLLLRTLSQARDGAVDAVSLLQLISSASAVTALPIRTV